jgi:phospholipase C
MLKRSSAILSVAALLQPTFVVAAQSESAREDWGRANSAPSVTVQPNLNKTVEHYAMSPHEDPVLPNSEMLKLIRDKVKYVFVIFNENNSFDHEYGTFPGVNGIYSDGQNPRPAADTPGFTQTYTDVNGTQVTVQPFRIGADRNATFQDSLDHSHTGLAAKLDVVYGQPRMDGFAKDEYSRFASSSAASAAAQKEGTQFARLVMSHVDCQSIPFFWQYANRFTIFDNIFATEDTPSSPNAIAMIAGQSGETQWVKHGATASAAPISGTINGTTYTGSATPAGVPVVNDPQPWWGSAFDMSTGHREPTAPKENWAPTNTSVNLTFATVPLTLAGGNIESLMSGDRDAPVDQADIQKDIPFIAKHGGAAVDWRWYQNGYSDVEPDEPSFATPGTHTNYVSHHNGAQYFGYLANNRNEWPNIKGEHNFFADILGNNLPRDGGVIYIRGGYYNLKSQLPPIQNPNYPNPAGLTETEIATINAAKSGDDDHPSYSDRNISETMAARVINAIAENEEIWRHSAIIITYDESDGLWDHVPPRILSYGPDGLPLARGIRIPLLLISPFARAGSVSHAEGDHNSVIETISAIFGLPALSSLPDEMAALQAGNSAAFNQFAQTYGPANFQQKWLGPRDTNTPITDSLLSGFSTMRLKGLAEPLPASYAIIPNQEIFSLPHYGTNGCAKIGVTPTDANMNIQPPGTGTSEPFNTLPSTLPAYN